MEKLCILRKIPLVWTPEEEVRQQIIQQLMERYQFPPKLMRLEVPIQYNQMPRRVDLVAYTREGAPLLLAEFKAPKIKLNEDSLQQMMRYNHIVKAPYLLLSNGTQTLIFQIDFQQGKSIQLDGLPTYAALCGAESQGGP